MAEPIWPGDEPATLVDVGKVLHQALSELGHVRKQLKNPFVSKKNLEATLERLQRGLAIQAQDLLASGISPQSTLNDAGNAGGLVFRRKEKDIGGYRMTRLPPISLTPNSTQEKAAAKVIRAVEKPQSATSRAILEEEFGVPAPTPPLYSTGSEQPGYTGRLSKGVTAPAAPTFIMPRDLRDDPGATAPPHLADREAEKGLLNLLNRGLLKNDLDLTPALVGEYGAVKLGAVAIHERGTLRTRPPITSAIEDAMIAADPPNIRYDLVTPVVPPSVDPYATGGSLSRSMRVVEVGLAVPAVRSAEGLLAAEAAELAAREYDALMDTFSLHEFLIRRGKLLDATPEFQSYMRTNEDVWHVVQTLIKNLEGMCAQYSVPLVVVDGRALADLARSSIAAGYMPQMEQCLSCITNIEEVAGILRRPGRRFAGPFGARDAATVIQAAVRGHLARRSVKKRKKAAGTIQAAWRVHRLRLALLGQLRQAHIERDLRFQELQLGFRERWPDIIRAGHVVLHLADLPRDVRQCQSAADAVRDRSAAQLARLCDLSEPLVEVLLLVSSPPDESVVGYWNKLLEVGGVSDPKSRYRVMFPENHARLPGHMSLALRTLSSPRCMSRLREATRGRAGYVLPGAVTSDEVALAVALGLPLLGPPPAVYRSLRSKTAARAIFRAARANVPPGLEVPPARVAPSLAPRPPNKEADLQNSDFEITTEGDVQLQSGSIKPPPPHTNPTTPHERLVSAVIDAMMVHPSVNKWLLKIDDESMGYGHAWFDVASIKGVTEVLERVIMEREAQERPDSPSSTLSEPLVEGAFNWSEALQVSRHRLVQLLSRHLPNRLSLAARDAYTSYERYASALHERGGVIEAVPDLQRGAPLVNLFIDPQGSIVVLSTHERLHGSLYRTVGSTFPAISAPHSALLASSLAAGSHLAAAGVSGHVTLEYVALLEETGLKLWMVDATPHITPALVAFQLFDFLTAGSFDPSTGAYVVEAEDGYERGMDDALSQISDSETMRSVHTADISDLPNLSDYDPNHGLGIADFAPPTYPKAFAAPVVERTRRCYVALDALIHPCLRALMCSDFFHLCWQASICFDIDNRLGAIFNLSERYTRGVLSVISVGFMPQQCLAALVGVLAFIGKIRMDPSLRNNAEVMATQKAYSALYNALRHQCEKQ